MKRQRGSCSQAGGWNNLHFGPIGNITRQADLLTTARLARGMPGMRRAIWEDPNLPFGSPCLLHSNPLTWPNDGRRQGIDASLMPMDAPITGAFVAYKEVYKDGDKHCVGGNGEWIALVQSNARWHLLNVYTKEEFELPSVRNNFISTNDSDNPFSYSFDMADMRLLKIQIPGIPYKIGRTWYYYVIAIFHNFISIRRGGTDRNWTILRNDHLAPSSYEDAIIDNGRIFAVTSPRGDMHVWEPTRWGASAQARVILSPILEQQAEAQAPGDHTYRCWFLSSGHNNSILWIHTRGERASSGPAITYMGRELNRYPTLRCHVFAIDGDAIDPVATNWVRQEHLHGRSVFVGMNYPFLLESQEQAAPSAENAGEDLPVFRPDCVFEAHRACSLYPKPIADWSRIPINGGPAIGSSLNYNEQDWGIYETPMWIVPTLPEILWGFSY